MSGGTGAGLEHLITVRPPETTARPEAVWDDAVILEHELIAERYHRLLLRSETISATAQAGQFVMITVPSEGTERILLPRPMAIHRRRPEQGAFEVIYNVVGRGTAALAAVSPGMSLTVTGPLGRGFEIPEQAGSVLLIGRGIGVCAVMGAAEDARDRGVNALAVLSGATPESLIGVRDCAELGIDVLAVDDRSGSSSVDSLEAALMSRFDAAPPEAVMVCGSSRLSRLAARLAERWDVGAQVSVEAHMACGLGYCHGCAAPVQTEPEKEGPLVCVDGPVFDLAASGSARLR